ncbi:hypothetical protein Rhe02_34750 [Rhizocola hellebori]|uniref:DNRLRE domain-containing protein n=1 Tax=Rhizocola hellebori TaxID=1392758 RepID=A0A8J3Q8Z6_9ACTN|nr:hypothetical protein [Rhizocola hellebori]GIH05408.1 hypothetical protein Rhe02_34750 [Rhizocola hellebori]
MARRILSATVAAVLAATVLTGATPASAFSIAVLRPVSWAYTDLHHPLQSFLGQDASAPVGARFGDDGYHSSRSYFRFDISQLRGKQILNADFHVHERSLCDNVSPVQLWLTDDVTATTSWLHPPRQRELLAQVEVGCGRDVQLAWDIDDRITQWLDAGRDHVTLSMRVSGWQEFDSRYGRAFGDNFLSVLTNLPPSGVHGVSPCGADSQNMPYLNGDLLLRGTYSDSDMLPENGSQYEDVTFAIWPVNNPAQRREFFRASYQDGVAELDWRDFDLAEGVYAWVFKVSDRSSESAWSSECFFGVDRTRPDVPTVASADYPDDGQRHGGTGIPGTFTFTPASPDTARFGWSLGGDVMRYVDAELGQPLTLQIAPTAAPPMRNVLRVHAIDRAGNFSAEARYEFLANDTSPELSFVVGGVSLPSTMTMSTQLPGAAEFRYTIDGGPQSRVPVGPQGSTTVGVVFEQTQAVVAVEVWSATTLLGVTRQQFIVDSLPDISVAHQPGSSEATVTVLPRRAGIVSYLYQLDYAGDYFPVTANADGSAVFTVTGLLNGYHTIEVISYTAAGYAAQASKMFEIVNTLRQGPYVSSPDYHPSPEPLGGVGIAGRFDLDGNFDADHYVVSYQGGPEFVVSCQWDCFSASFTLAPQHSGVNTLTAWAVYPDGSRSLPSIYTFEVA